MSERNQRLRLKPLLQSSRDPEVIDLRAAVFLVIEAQPGLAPLLEEALDPRDFSVLAVSDLEAASERCRRQRVDIVFVVDGLLETRLDEACARLHAETAVRIMALSADTSLRDDLLFNGVDDFITIPYAHRELLARTFARLRRARVSVEKRAEPRFLQFRTGNGGPFIDAGNGSVPLTPIEYRMLLVLHQRFPSPVSREAMKEALWGEHRTTLHAVDVHLSNVRQKLRGVGVTDQLINERGVGVRLARQIEKR